MCLYIVMKNYVKKTKRSDVVTRFGTLKKNWTQLDITYYSRMVFLATKVVAIYSTFVMDKAMLSQP
jgi:hypothetical protein